MARQVRGKVQLHSREVPLGVNFGAPHGAAVHAVTRAVSRSTGQGRAHHHRRLDVTHAQMGMAASSSTQWAEGCQLLSSVNELPTRYKGVLLDQYGCLHDGQTPYAGAIEAVRSLAERGLKILLLSNSSRRSAGALDKIAKLGFDRDWFVGVVTSGEVAHQHLEDRPTAFWQNLGSRVLHFTWSSRGQVVLDDALGLEVTENPVEADFILAHGTEAISAADGSGGAAPRSIEQLETLLRQAAAAGQPPMIVANPDIVTTSGDLLVTMPGALGRYYALLGGQVHLMGKPNPVIYEAARKLLDLQPSEVIAIGDSLEHDIAGAAAAGIDSLFVGGGIHAAALGISSDGRLAVPTQTLRRLCQDGGLPLPTYATTILQV